MSQLLTPVFGLLSIIKKGMLPVHEPKVYSTQSSGRRAKRAFPRVLVNFALKEFLMKNPNSKIFLPVATKMEKSIRSSYLNFIKYICIRIWGSLIIHEILFLNVL